MTREEAKEMHELARDGRLGEFRRAEMLNVIDSIYDDFESRTCEGCNINDLCDWQSAIVEYIGHIPKDFGCNKWEKKNV